MKRRPIVLMLVFMNFFPQLLFSTLFPTIEQIERAFEGAGEEAKKIITGKGSAGILPRERYYEVAIGNISTDWVKVTVYYDGGSQWKTIKPKVGVHGFLLPKGRCLTRISMETDPRSSAGVSKAFWQWNTDDVLGFLDCRDKKFIIVNRINNTYEVKEG